MNLDQGNIYHIFNQGNNRETIFFKIENYLYFMAKIKKHICPFADVLAWCLMPNHFHLMIAVREDAASTGERLTQSHPLTTVAPTVADLRFNNEIAIMLRSYTRAINIQEKRTGSLFREHTQAKWLGSLKSEIIKIRNRSQNEIVVHAVEEEEYVQSCYTYIHVNPVKAGLVKKSTDWEFSSAREIEGNQTDTIINKNLILLLGLHLP